MKVTMELTLDGLLRALKLRAHRLADEIEAGRIEDDANGRHGRAEMMAARGQERRLRNERIGD